MLALHHLFSGTPASDLVGLESVMERAGGAEPVRANRAVLVGTALSPAETRTKPDGTMVRTLWGEMAWQLLGKDGYAMVADADKRGVSPGSDTLRELFTAAAPCLILTHEWVAFLRNMYKVDGLPAGSFEANLTFAQALTEAAKLAPRTLVVASIPASNIEIGGEGGFEALERIQNTFSRVESSWRPASTEESFEIVRRRLFQPIDHERAPMRDAVVRAFCNLYREQSGEFPSGAREADYERRMQAAYPIHPELFDQLFNAWSSLDRFQRTRGVLRLMATVIHHLWEREDKSLLILPSGIPIDAHSVQSELTRYLEDNWVPVIENDVDGPQSLPLQQDRENPNRGRYSAARRVARTLFMGSAPTLQMANKGIDDRQIKLGCVQPGESVATFGDALRRLTDRATHLYVDGSRYWFSTQPSVTRMAQDRAARVKDDAVHEEIRRRVRDEVTRNRGEFAGVHPMPGGSGDVPDEHEARLVVLGPEHAHSARNESSPARVEVHDILENRGNSPRLYRNMLLFLAPDRTRLDELDSAVRQYLAWKSIEAEKDELNLDTFQRNQALTQRDRAADAVKARIPETYIWLLAPGQPDKTGGIEWQEIRLSGGDPIAVRASKRACNDELLITRYAGALLRMQLDAIPLWRGPDKAHVHVKQLAEDYAQYLYLPRLSSTNALIGAIEDGVGQISWEADSFAYAQSHDEAAGRYRGLQAGEVVRVSLDSSSVVVRPAVAAAQLATDRAAQVGAVVHAGGGEGTAASTAGGVTPAGGGVSAGGQGGLFEQGGGVGAARVAEPAAQRRPTRFYGTASLDPKRISRDAAQIAEEVVQHLTALVGADVEVTIEIQARVPAGVPENVVRTVLENCRTLKFGSQGFEEE
jgi:predicted AAA+ superfamily ATPase